MGHYENEMAAEMSREKRCQFCGADGKEATVAEYLAKVQGCNNCRADIAMKGQWTGDGWDISQRIKARLDAGDIVPIGEPK